MALCFFLRRISSFDGVLAEFWIGFAVVVLHSANLLFTAFVFSKPTNSGMSRLFCNEQESVAWKIGSTKTEGREHPAGLSAFSPVKHHSKGMMFPPTETCYRLSWPSRLTLRGGVIAVAEKQPAHGVRSMVCLRPCLCRSSENLRVADRRLAICMCAHSNPLCMRVLQVE